MVTRPPSWVRRLSPSPTSARRAAGVHAGVSFRCSAAAACRRRPRFPRARRRRRPPARTRGPGAWWRGRPPPRAALARSLRLLLEQREELAQDARGGAPGQVLGRDLVEEDRVGLAVPLPQLGAEDGGVAQGGQRHLDDALDLATVRL